MKNRKFLKHTAICSFLFALAAGFLVSYHLEKHYKKGDYIPEIDAYFERSLDDPAGLIKAKKYVTPTDNKYSYQKTRSLGSSFIGNIESVWDQYTGEGTTVAIIDDGFDVDHPEFTRSDNSSAILSTSRNYYVDDKGTNKTSDDEVVYQQYSSYPHCLDEDWEEGEDQYGNTIYEWATHGTATSTTAAAPMGNGGGVGIAPGADILALKIDFSFAAIESAIYYAIEQGVDVINMSLGAYSENFTDGWGDTQQGSAAVATYLEDACQAAYDAGIIVVAAAGNESTWHKSYPACNAHVVGVGAIGDYDNKGNADVLAEFSNYVSTSQTGEINVDILAPGYVYTAEQTWAKSSDKNSSSVPSSHGHTYNDTQGTSFSSPIVAGAACLWKQKNPSGTPSQFLSELQASADGIGYYTDKMVPVSGWYPELTDVGPSNITNGRLNVSRLLGTDVYVNVEETNVYLLTGKTKQINITSSNGNITYSSNNPSVATVSNSGLITAKGAGNATITVTATIGVNTATANVYVNVQDIVETTSLSFSESEVSVEVGKTYNAEPLVTLTPNNASRVFLFESENESIATVDEDTGVITGVAEGDATINCVAVYGDGDDSLTVHVTPASAPTSWDKITSTTDLEDGDYLIVYEGSSKAFNGGLSTLDATNNNIGVTIANSSITYSETTEAAKFTIASVTGGYSIKSASGYYIGRGANSNGMDTSTSEAYVNTISFTNGNAIINGSGGKQLLFNTANDQQRFRYSSNGGDIQLYKGATGSTPTPTPTPKTLSSITLNTTNVKKAFEVGDTFNYTGLVVTAHYSDESSATVTPTSVTTPNMATAGNKTVTVTYTESAVTKTDTYQITVSEASTPVVGDLSTVTYTISSKTAASVSSGTAPSGSSISFNNNGNNDNDQLANGKRALWTLSGYEGYVITKIEVNLRRSSGGGNGSITLTNNSVSVALSMSSTTSSSVSTSYAYKTVYNQEAGFEVDGEVALTITANQSSLYCNSIKVTYGEIVQADKIVDSLSVSYTGGNVFVGDDLDTSKVSVTAKYTDSSKYPDAVLPSSDYQLSGFNSSSAGNKTVTVTYTGSLNTSTAPSPLTTTFNVTVVTDNVKNVAVTCSKAFHPGDTIAKGDITVTLTYDSDKVETTTDFTFANDGYQFTYADAASGGSNTQKQFTITYAGNPYNFNVNVSRIAHQTISPTTCDLTGAQGASAGITGTGAGGMASYDSLVINGVTCAATNIYVYTSGGKEYFSFGKGEGELHNTVALSQPMTSFAINGRASSARTDERLYVSETGADGTWVLVSAADFANNSYYFFKVACESTSSSYSNFNLRIGLRGQDNATNVANYIMYEDTNNQCTTKLPNAISYFESMSKAERTTFMTSEDYVIATARTRLEAWLTNQHKTITIVDGDYVISNNMHSISILSENNNETIVIAVASSFLLISVLGCFYLFKKRSHKTSK